MTRQSLREETKDGVLTLTLDRPDNLNAFTVEMAEELVDAFTRASRDDGVRAVVVTGRDRDSLAMFYTSIGDGVEGVASFLDKRDPEFTGSTNAMPPFYPWW